MKIKNLMSLIKDTTQNIAAGRRKKPRNDTAFFVKASCNALKFLALIERALNLVAAFLLLKDTSNRHLRLVVDGVVLIAENRTDFNFNYFR
jgi:hypothetical protein